MILRSTHSMNTPAAFYAMQNKMRERFRRKFCLHPAAPNGCSKNSGAAHTVQRALIAKYLAEDNHVLKFSMDFNPKLNEPLVLSKVGVNKATTFYGFCGLHDDALFKLLEAREFTFEARQIALLGFRSFSRELYCKEAELEMTKTLIDYMLQHPDPQTLDRVECLKAKYLGSQNARQNLRRAWSQFGEAVESTSPDELRYHALLFSHAPVYLASAAFLPEWDFDGTLLQDLNNLREFHGISFSSWAASDKAAAVFCWHQSCDSICLPFINSLHTIEKTMVANRILAMAFEFSENVIFRPSWWESLKQADKDLLSTRVASGGQLLDRESDCLAADGLRAIESSTLKIVSNVI